MEGKNGKNSSSSKTPNEQRSPQRAQGSTQRQPPSSQRQPPSIQRQPPPSVQELPHPSRNQGGPSLGGRLWGRMPPVNFLHAVPIGGSTGYATAGIGGFATDAASRKRVRETASQGMVAAGRGDAGDPALPFACTICGRSFPTDKSLFGHMRTHRGRPWKGALPPPVFSRDEFAETGLLNPVGGEEAGQEDEEVDQQVVHGETPAATQGRRRVQYLVPDLNQSPPKEGNGDDDNN